MVVVAAMMGLMAWADAAEPCSRVVAGVRKSGVPCPEQVHISVGDKTDAQGNPIAMAIGWYTHAKAASLVQVAELDDGAKNVTVHGSSMQYLDDHGYHHTASVLGRPGASYRYRVGDGVGPWSETFKFTMPPPSGASITKPLKVSIFGDMGYLSSEERPMVITVAGLKKTWSAVPTRQRLEQMKDEGALDMIWHVGDIGYIDDAFAHDPLRFMYEDAYDGYMGWLQNLSATIPYMVSPGNHESECHIAQCQLQEQKYGKHLNNFTAFNARWHMPSQSSGGALNMWYSWNYGPVHFVSINTETDFPTAEERRHGDASSMPAGKFGRPGEYLAWLEADLAKAYANRAMRPWIIAGGHRPCCHDIPGVARLFEKYGVVLYFAGHTHSYWRSNPSFANMTTTIFGKAKAFVFNSAGPAATTYVTAGGAGCDEMTLVKDEGNKADPWYDCADDGICLRRRPGAPLPAAATDPHQVVSSGRLASGVLTVYNTSVLRWQAVASTSGEIFDDITITRN